jgi:prepilin-type N-terminal cleavage/methylation domain-containing protein
MTHKITSFPAGRSAFSLTEILLVVAIIGLVGLFAVPNLRRQRVAQRLDEAVSSVVAELKAARTLARSEARPVVIGIDPSARTLTRGVDRNEDGVFSSAEKSVLDLGKSPVVAVSVNTTQGVFQPGGDFSCSASVWKIRLTAAGVGDEFVYVFRGGMIERTTEVL